MGKSASFLSLWSPPWINGRTDGPLPSSIPWPQCGWIRKFVIFIWIWIVTVTRTPTGYHSPWVLRPWHIFLFSWLYFLIYKTLVSPLISIFICSLWLTIFPLLIFARAGLSLYWYSISGKHLVIVADSSPVISYCNISGCDSEQTLGGCSFLFYLVHSA